MVEHDEICPVGTLGERAGQLGVELVVHRPLVDGTLPRVDDFDLVVLLGSPHSTYDPAIRDWFEPELALVRDAVGVGVPVLGVCFGAQALATALGGEVHPAPRPELGWMRIDTDDPEVEPGPWLQWHVDAFTVPVGARELARTSVGPQAFALGPHLGVQFHPEVTPEGIEPWIELSADELDRQGIDPDDLRRQTAQRAALTRAGAHRLFDRLCDRAAARANPGPSGPP